MFQKDSFLSHLEKERRLSPHTLLAYSNDLEQFLSYCKDIYSLASDSDVRHLHIRTWVVTQLEDGQQARSVNRRLSCLKSYFKFLLKRGYLLQDPMEKVIGPKTPKRLPVVAREQDLQLLFSTLPFPDGYKGLLHRSILEVLYATGLRRGELAALQTSDIDFSRGVLRVLGKGNKLRFAPIVGPIVPLLRQFLELRNQQFPTSEYGQLFLSTKGLPLSPESIYAVVRKYLSQVSRNEQNSPHVLRHSFATHLSDKGADLNAIRELLGHSNLAATQIYLHNSIEKLKKVYEQAHPTGGQAEKEEDSGDTNDLLPKEK